jgi:magnesium-transporting ATPase (P-type)
MFSSSCFYELIKQSEHQISGQETEIGLINVFVTHMKRWIYEAKIRDILDQNKLQKQVSFNTERKWMAVLA